MTLELRARLRAEWVRPALLAIGYYLLSRFSLEIIDPQSQTTVMWPAAGLAVGLIATAEHRRWGWLAVAVFAGNWIAEYELRGFSWLGVALATVNVLEVLACSAVMVAIVGRPGLDRNSMRRVAGLGAAVLAVVPAAALGSAILDAGGHPPFLGEWRGWLESDGTGIAVLAPLIIALGNSRRWQRRWPSRESLGVVLVTFVLSAVVFTLPSAASVPTVDYSLLLIPLLWAAVRLPERMLAAALVAFGITAAYATSHQLGPFSTKGLLEGDRLLQLQVYLVVVTAVTLAISALVAERQAVVRRLAAERELLASALRAAEDYAVVAADEHRLVTIFNHGAERLLGLTAEQMLGRPAPTFMLDGDAGEASRRTLEVTVPRGDGADVALAASITAIPGRDGGPPGLLAIARDIGPERDAQRAVQDSEQRHRTLAQRLETILDATGDAVYGVDCDGHITFVNRAAELQTGFRAHEMLGANAHELMHHSRPDGSPYPASECPIAHVYTTGGERRGSDEVFWRADGTSFPIEYKAQPLHDGDRLVGSVLTVADITARKLSQDRLAAAEERFRSAFAGAPVPIALISLEGTFLDVNAALCEFVAYDRHELIGRPVRQITHASDWDVCFNAINGVLGQGGDVTGLEMRFLCAGGQVVVGRLQATAIRDAAGAPQHLVVHVLDMTERTRYEAQLQHMTDHDHLTGLLNRRRFEIELELAVAAGAHGDARGAVIVLDLDDFKEINHIVGHTGADELLVSVAGILRGRLRESDVLARLGGDEFAVLLPSADAIAAEATADSLVTAVRSGASIQDRDRSRAVTASAGATTFEGGAGASADAVIRDAEFAMYDAKEAGRDGAAFFAQAHTGQSATKSRLAWVRRIERAIDDGSFVLYAQPILDLRANEITRFELLLRMLDDHGDRIPPDAFLPVAERHGLITRIDRWVIGEAIRRLAEAQASGTEHCFEVNLSGASIGDRQLLDAITSELRNTGVTPSNLIFEITETAAVADIARARRFAQALRELGCRFALDDFGAGFGSFFYLKHLPFDYLKIDGEFISNCVEDRTDQLVIRAVVQVAEGLGKETIAEFVGDADTRRMVQRLGVDFAQGAHISMPVPLEQALLLTAGAEG